MVVAVAPPLALLPAPEAEPALLLAPAILALPGSPGEWEGEREGTGDGEQLEGGGGPEKTKSISITVCKCKVCLIIDDTNNKQKKTN